MRPDACHGTNGWLSDMTLGLGYAPCCGLNFSVSQNSYVEILTPQCNGIWKQGLWEAIRS